MMSLHLKNEARNLGMENWTSPDSMRWCPPPPILKKTLISGATLQTQSSRFIRRSDSIQGVTGQSCRVIGQHKQLLYTCVLIMLLFFWLLGCFSSSFRLGGREFSFNNNYRVKRPRLFFRCRFSADVLPTRMRPLLQPTMLKNPNASCLHFYYTRFT